jgi:YHS domain-containing protein
MKVDKLERKVAHATKEELVFDLVCGMEIVQKDARYLARYNGATYYFCSTHCKHHFDSAPLRYVWER